MTLELVTARPSLTSAKLSNFGIPPLQRPRLRFIYFCRAPPSSTDLSAKLSNLYAPQVNNTSGLSLAA